MKKFKNYITSENDKLYSNLVEFDKYKKIKILRYFNYITPYIKKISNVIENVWTLKTMESNEEYNDIWRQHHTHISQSSPDFLMRISYH